MKQEAFDLLHAAEQSWWYKGRSLAIRATLKRARFVTPIESILDFGAGFGGMYAELARLSSQIDAFEPDATARAVATSQGYRSIFTTASEALSHHYNLIGIFDVVEHIEDDRAFLISLRGALAPDGVLAITVPAFQFLWSEHDVEHQHFRRYNKRSLSKLLLGAGYEILAISYWNTLLFFPAALVRLLGRSGSSALMLGGFVNSLLLFVVIIESKILRFISLPFGVSLIVVARKNKNNP
jgi:2-polyprenyl-3-methyl-5-hydroxy-6-metoxy-1,4-benzoquinol methylase